MDVILFACFSKCLWNKCCQVEEKSEMTTFLKFKVKSRYLLELGVRRSKGRDGCWPLGWEQCVDKESITQCLLVSGNKTGCGVMVERTTWWKWKVRYGSKESLCRMEEGAVQVGLKLYPFMVTRFKVVLYLESEPWSRNRAGHMKEWGFGREKGVRIFTPLFRGRMIFTWDRRKNHLTLRLISWIPNKHILPTIFYKTSLIQFNNTSS